MNIIRENKDLACFYTTKHSWRGKYKRVFSVGTHAITTYNPNTLEVTNQWPYGDICSVSPVGKGQGTEFNLTFRKGSGKKSETLKFSTEHRTELLTEALRFRTDFSEGKITGRRYNCYKHHWSDTRKPVILEVTPGGFDQINPATNRVLCSYDYRNIEGFVDLSDYQGGFCILYGGFSRLHLFASEQREEIIKSAIDHAGNYIGISLRIRKEPLEFEQYLNLRFGKYSTDESITSLAEFIVQKISPRHSEPVKRVLALTETCLVERDPATYNIATLKPLGEVFALVCDSENPQLFTIEFIKGQIRKYSSTERDSLLASLLDGVRASGNRDVCVKMTSTHKGQRWGLLSMPVDEEVESLHLRFLATPPNGNFADAVFRFNANISYSGVLHAVTQDGLFSENKEKLINNAITALLSQEGDAVASIAELESQFQAVRRLVASKAGFLAFTQLPKFRERLGVKVVKALKRNNNGVIHAAVDMLCALMCPMHDDYDLRQEQLNKASLLSSKKFLENLLEKFNSHVDHGTGALVISSLLDFLTFALCAPYSETTEGQQFDMLLEMVASNGRTLFKLFQHPSMAIVKGAGLVMKAIIEEGDKEIATKMQELALSEGALPRHLHTAMFTISSDQRMLTNRQLSRHLVGLWTADNATASNLLKRILPPGLLAYLDSSDPVPERDADRMHVRDNVKIAMDQYGKFNKVPEWQRLAGKAAKEVEKFAKEKVDLVLMHWRDRMGIAQKEDRNNMNINQKPVVLRKRRQRIKIEANWDLFYYRFAQDHAKSNLIWNFKTREELRDSLESEMRAFNIDRELGSANVISWNHHEFEVKYECLAEEIKIGDYYLRLLLEEDENEESGSIKRSYEFFNELYHRFLLTPKVNMKCLCLQALAIVYGRCHEEIGPFTDTRYIIGMLERCTDKLERDRLILFLNKLILNKKNVKDLMDSNGVRILVDLLTLAHLHVSRATVPLQSNVIEAAPDMKRESEKEWYFGNADKERSGPYGFHEMQELWTKGTLNAKTRCWAQGMDGWRPLQAIPQLKWCLLASGQSVLNETDLATLILNMLITMCGYFPSRDQDNAIIRPLPRVKRLLSDSACLPHIIQITLVFLTTFCFGLKTKGQDIFQRSILGHILPEAMVCYLENYEPEKFSEIFLGEFDTPEAIWSSEMRRLMIEKIATHLADFTPRLQSNTRALYQYCPIPVINYPQLENELFCNIYYLKQLCDTLRFPDWPIKDPVKLLKDTLDAWKKEVEKKPPMMSIDDAYEVLNLPQGQGPHDESKIRKAYFRLAQKYHPDKNPEGRDMFEKVNKAYEFLCTKSAKIVDGPDPENIILILKTQSILFNRHKEEESQMPVCMYIDDRGALNKGKAHWIAQQSQAMSAEILKMLNSNTENPYLIWNNSTRAELLEFLESQQENMVKKGDCDKTYGSEFVYSDHAKELIVGEIFVRVYNEVPTFQLEVPKAFAASLLDYIGSQAQYLHTFMAITHAAKVQSEQHGDRLPRVEMALEALRNVIKYNPGSESECIGHFKLIFSLLRVHGAGQVQQLALEVVNIVTSNQDCVNNIAESMVLSNLLALLHSLPSSRQLVLETLYALTSSTKIIKEAMAKGALIYLLDMFCNSTHPQVRAQTAELFAKMTADKLIGPKVRLTLMKFLPSVFMDAMRDNPEAAVHIFEGTHENPELIWNDSSRDKVSTTVREMMLEHFKNQRDNPDVNWKLPEDFTVVFGEAEGEVAVGGVFLRIFIAQPTWVLRKPREFLIALLEKLTELLEKNNPHGETLETLTTATVCLFSAQPQLADQVPPLGHLPKVIQAMNHRNNAIPKSAIRVIHALSDNELCVRAMASLETIGPLMNGMKKRPDIVGLACEAINRMFQKEQSDLVAQALKADLVPYLLKLLEGIGLENLDSPAATKAQIVKALKAMTRSLQHGEQVNEILSRSSVWSAFKDQKHDLFISDSQTAGYLTGPGVAGYLTAGTSSSVMSNLPPPVDHEAGDLGYHT
ncbi:dnaJ homolog subfamily C member 13 [Rhinolophus sinicus]|uniref:dnaJ homolog subfamily C member 13 n=1 Tax=Rhinolophus sinicus TaxID=89399 RepID=UPI003D7999BE